MIFFFFFFLQSLQITTVKTTTRATRLSAVMVQLPMGNLMIGKRPTTLVSTNLNSSSNSRQPTKEWPIRAKQAMMTTHATMYPLSVTALPQDVAMIGESVTALQMSMQLLPLPEPSN